MPRSTRHAERLSMGPGAVLTVSEAAGLLPVADRDARAWLRREQLVRDLAGRAVVLWADVLDRLRAGAGPADPSPASPAVSLPRTRL